MRVCTVARALASISPNGLLRHQLKVTQVDVQLSPSKFNFISDRLCVSLLYLINKRPHMYFIVLITLEWSVGTDCLAVDEIYLTGIFQS